jgi:hypothetical protein
VAWRVGRRRSHRGAEMKNVELTAKDRGVIEKQLDD